MNANPTHVGNYRIERELLGQERRVVYQGWQTALNQPVAITQLTTEAAADTNFVNRWKQVARDLRAPGHPHLVRILDGDFLGELPYLVESYLIADRLSDRITVGQGLVDALQLWFDLADALGYAHRRGWAYGDLKADNVRVMDNGSAYLVDLPWQAAQREHNDETAMRSDVAAITALFVAIRQPIAGDMPEVEGQDDLQALTQWLAQGEEPDSGELASELAPVLIQALDHSAENAYPTCAELAEALRPLLQAGRPTVQKQEQITDRTIVGPPPSSMPYASTPSDTVPPSQPPTPQSPTPYTPSHQGTQPPPLPPPYSPPPPKRGGGIWALVAVGAVIGIVIVAGVVLCIQEVLPFCASCEETLITQYVHAAESYIERNAWEDAERDLDAALAECALCGDVPAPCATATALIPSIVCFSQTEKLVEDGDRLLETGEVCQAVENLEKAVSLGCDTKVAEALLTAKADEGAYVQCADTLLTQETEDACIEAFEYLNKAYEMKPSNLEISDRFEQADTFWTFLEAYDSEQWDEAQESLDVLTSTIPAGTYCGTTFDDFQYDILFGQGVAFEEEKEPCEAKKLYEQAQTAATTMGQESESKKAVEAATTACVETWTPTPTPTLTPTPTNTPTPTPQPVAVVNKGEVQVREGPHMRHKKTGAVKKDDVGNVMCSSDQDDGLWYDLEFPKVVGWIRGDMVDVTEKSYLQMCSPTLVPASPTPVPPRYCWTSKLLGINEFEQGRTELVVYARDENGSGLSGTRIQVKNPYGGKTLGDQDTDANGATSWAAVTRIDWDICILPDTACIKTPYDPQAAGQQVILEFKKVRCN